MGHGRQLLILEVTAISICTQCARFAFQSTAGLARGVSGFHAEWAGRSEVPLARRRFSVRLLDVGGKSQDQWTCPGAGYTREPVKFNALAAAAETPDWRNNVYETGITGASTPADADGARGGKAAMFAVQSVWQDRLVGWN